MTRYLFWLSIATLSLIGLVLGTIALVLLSLPNVEKIQGCMTTEMFQVRLCPSEGNYVRLKEISPHLIASIIISEDAAFYQHKGFDFSEIKESVNRNLKEGAYARGASTITQQLVKNVFLSQEKSLLRKLKEAFLTYEIEKLLKKNQILEYYLNVVQFGDKVFGIKQAARHYFGKAPSELNVLESAFLTALLPSPVKYSQSFKQKKLTAFMRGRISTISRKLLATGRISHEEYSFAKANIDAFPWTGLGSAIANSDEMINNLQNTDFSKADVLESDDAATNAAETSEESGPASTVIGEDDSSKTESITKQDETSESIKSENESP